MNSSAQERIRASGRVVRVDPKYVYIHSERYGSVFGYPAAYFNSLPDPPPTNKLTDVLRVDDVVHFVAVPQHGQNDCHWIALNITKRQRQNSNKDENTKVTPTLQRHDLPEYIENIQGTIIELYDRNGVIYSDRFGKIYFPMAAAAESNELYPLNTLFYDGESVLFDAQRQPCKNDCLYIAIRVQSLPSDYTNGDSNAAVLAPKMGKETNSDSGAIVVNEDVEKQECGGQEFQYEEGDIIRISSQYGYIRSDALGSVFFTLSHYESETYVSSLLDVLSLGDRVQFIRMPQEERNGCRWRGIKVKKVAVDMITPLAQYFDQASSMMDNNHERIVCEVSVQTDQSLWSSFLASQVPPASSRRRDHNRAPAIENATQTRMPPEALLLKAVKEDDELKEVLRQRFPHLMLFIDKNT